PGPAVAQTVSVSRMPSQFLAATAWCAIAQLWWAARRSRSVGDESDIIAAHAGQSNRIIRYGETFHRFSIPFFLTADNAQRQSGIFFRRFVDPSGERPVGNHSLHFRMRHPVTDVGEIGSASCRE